MRSSLKSRIRLLVKKKTKTNRHIEVLKAERGNTIEVIPVNVFVNPQEAAEITVVHFYRLKIILNIICAGLKVHRNKFAEYGIATA